MRTKIGPFPLAKTYDIERVASSFPPIFKGYHLDYMRDLYHRVGDTCTFVARHYNAGHRFESFENGLAMEHPEDAAKKWWDYTRLEIAPYRNYPFYYESFNEPEYYYLSQYGRFEAERQRIMYNEGYRACIASFGAGGPDVSESPEDSRIDLWEQFYPALDACHRYRNLLGLHEYGGLWMSLWFGEENQHGPVMQRRTATFPETHEEGWLFGRYRKVWRRHIQPNGWTGIRIALTEFGLDHTGELSTDALTGTGVSHWRSCVPHWQYLNGRGDGEQFYLEQLRWADRQMQQDSYVVGATLFAWGVDAGSSWSNFDVTGTQAGEGLLADMRSAVREVLPAGGLFIRTREGGTPLTVLRQGEPVVVYEQSADWSRVENTQGIMGWSMTDFLGEI